MPNELKTTVRLQFGSSASQYATSEIHAKGESLGMLVALSCPQSDWTMLDVATGAGHTAFIFSPHVARVVATDLTEPMLQQTTALADEKHLKNIDVTAADAEYLPFTSAVFDAVTCRLALHHFPNPGLAITEFRRVLKPNGVLALTDNITVEDTTAAAYYNAYEKLRDLSHHRVYTLQELTDLLTTGGFIVQASRKLTKELEFEAWADRQHVSSADKHVLADKMRHLPDALRELFQPRWENDTMYFSLWKAVLVSRLESTKDRVAPRGQQNRLPLNQTRDRV